MLESKCRTLAKAEKTHLFGFAFIFIDCFCKSVLNFSDGGGVIDWEVMHFPVYPPATRTHV